MKLLPLLLLALSLCTCASADVGPPPVDVQHLSSLLADLQLAEALMNEVPIVLKDSVRSVYFDNILAEHGSNRAEFDSLMWIVRQEPTWMDSVYTQAGEVLAAEANLY